MVYQQAAGFVRIPAGEAPLDRSWIHPESHPIVEAMAAKLNVGIADLIGNREVISGLNLDEFVTDTAGMPTVAFIRDELLDPGRDPRGTYAPPRIRADVRDITDLKEGLTLEGTVTNVTNFGAFVDIGIQQDGLVHLSQMSNRFIRDPREAVKVGDLVQVKVISIEVESKRIGLSMKVLLPAQPRHRRKPRRRVSVSGEAGPAAPPVEGGEAGPDIAPNPEAGSSPRPPAQAGRRDQGNRRPRNRRRGPRNDDRPERVDARRREPAPAVSPDPPPEPDPEPKGPEPTLQEKIAILQSKFRGIQ